MAIEVRQHGKLTLTIFDPKRLRVAIGKRTASQALRDFPAADCILDGPMYNSKGVQYRLVDRAGGVDHKGQFPSRGYTVSVVNGAAEVLRGTAVPDGASVAVQGWPDLVSAGQSIASGSGNLSERTWRAALCVMVDGRLAFAVMPAVGMPTFAAALIAAGVVHAVYTDGGGSAEIAMRDGRRWGHTEDRSVASWLYVESEGDKTAIPAVDMAPESLVSGPIPTIYNRSGAVRALQDARPLLLECRPPAVQIHAWSAPDVAIALRELLPGVKLIMGVGVDGVAREVANGSKPISWGVKQLSGLARKAVGIGALAIVWNAEADWKRPPNSDEKKRLSDLIRATLATVHTECPEIQQWHSAYDHPDLHSSYPWNDWLGDHSPIVVSLPQVYAAPAGAVMAHRGALPAREARALASWGKAVSKGWIKPDVPDGQDGDDTDIDWRPYYQLHDVQTYDTVSAALNHPFACLWALSKRSDGRERADKAGRNALRALCELHRRGLWKPDGVHALQRMLGLKADGLFGPATARAAGITGWE
jgi:hypothetical protein